MIAGPTASGKSALAVKLAKKYNGEIISADSRQVYRGMDIGTGKITRAEMKGVPHHLLDVASARTVFDVARYQRMAHKSINEILARGKFPIVCGGTGLYIKSLVENVSYPNVKPDLKLRARLEKKSTRELFALLEKKDLSRAHTIDKHNQRRLIRALEIVANSGAPVPKTHAHPLYNALTLGISVPHEQLKQKIKKRLVQRVKKGMIREVAKLHTQGISWKRLAEMGLEYRYISLYLQGKMEKGEMLEILETKIGQYAKRQMTWFRKTSDIHWIHTLGEAEKLANAFFKIEV